MWLWRSPAAPGAYYNKEPVFRPAKRFFMDYKKTDLLWWLIPVLVSTMTASVFGQNQSATTAPAIEPVPSASATATDAAAKEAEAQQTLAYANAVINYCNRINSFLLTIWNLDREIERALHGEVAAKKYLAPPLFSVDTEYYKTNAETVPDSLSEADRAFFVNQVQSLKETQSRGERRCYHACRLHYG
jgi:hypothetical protein